MVCATNEGLYATCSPYCPGIMRFTSTSTTGTERKIELTLNNEGLNEAAISGVSGTSLQFIMILTDLFAVCNVLNIDFKGFFGYVAGAAAEIVERFQLEKSTGASLPGIDINNYKTNLPMGKGLSSSAAVCVLVVKCFSAQYSLNLSVNECMEIAYRGELRTLSRCGRMDQCVAMGTGKVGCMEFDRQDCYLRILTCKKSLHFVVADLNRGKNTVQILKALSSCFPYPQDEISV